MKTLINLFDLELTVKQIILTLICTSLGLTSFIVICKLIGFYLITKGF